MYNIVLFDLDGTLTDPGEGITNSVAYALKKFNIEVEDRKELYNFIGPPLIDSFMKFYGMNYEDGLKAVEYYREYFGVTGIFENTMLRSKRSFLDSITKVLMLSIGLEHNDEALNKTISNELEA